MMLSPSKPQRAGLPPHAGKGIVLQQRVDRKPGGSLRPARPIEPSATPPHPLGGSLEDLATPRSKE